MQLRASHTNSSLSPHLLVTHSLKNVYRYCTSLQNFFFFFKSKQQNVKYHLRITLSRNITFLSFQFSLVSRRDNRQRLGLNFMRITSLWQPQYPRQVLACYHAVILILFYRYKKICLERIFTYISHYDDYDYDE